MKETDDKMETARTSPRSVTYGLLVVNLLVFLAMSHQGGSTNIEVLQRFGANDARRIWDGEYWRLITPIFLHIGMLHLLLNGFALLALGPEVERHLGGPLFLLLYLLSGLCGNVATLLFTHGLSAGASGAIFGLAGAILMLEVLHGVNPFKFMARREGYSILPIILINLILGFQIPQIDNSGHIGGLLGGIVFGYCLLAEKLGRGAPERRMGIAISGVTLLAVSLGYGLFPVFDSRWYSHRGIAFLEREDFAHAREQFTHALRAFPRSHLPYLLLGEAEEGLHHPTEALRAYAQAVHLKPDDPFALDKLAQAHATEGRFALAIPYLEKAVRLHEPSRRSYERLGVLYERVGRHDKALIAYKSATAVHPHDDALWLRLGAAHLSGPNREYLAALDAFERALAIQPHNAVALSMKAHCLLRLGRFEESLKDAAEIVQRHPKDGLGYMDAASAYMAMKEFEKAIECAARAMKLSPSNTRAPDL
ncbi:MAG: rhomboid family intramembrane serine protease, partial [Planctomycetes bacterium]|nr:rhomboid family intramembrane serine protease [Planctomycetota bacterium]